MKGNFKMVFSILLLECTFYCSCMVEGEVDENCTKSDCGCCANNHCGPGMWFPDQCLSGCIDGHRGSRCYRLCINNCKSCPNSADECTSCYDGFYQVRTSCKKCPVNCKSCSSSTYCTSCNEGFQHFAGSHTCDISICPANCECNQGECVTCKTGYYDTKVNCNNTCPINCVNCTSSEECGQCKDGYYNGYGLYGGSRILLNNCTHKCLSTCVNCSSDDGCLQCPKGKHGLQCQKDCSAGCKDNTCSIENGQCDCSSNFSGYTCTECKSGKFGEGCKQSCPVNCKYGICDNFSGHCTDGCTTDQITGYKCNTCVIGMYGDLCEKPCTENCEARKCEKDNGHCIKCKDNFNGSTCEDCIKGKYGNECKIDCSHTCENKVCEKQTGRCIKCIANFEGEKCNQCIPGLYGENCDKNCSPNCVNATCDRTEGMCKFGCKGNYSGDKCCLKNENCVHCSSNTECRECQNGYFQNHCEDRCSENCLSSCDFSTGFCIRCVINKFGSLCNSNCSENCNTSNSRDTSKCSSHDGTCTFGCKDGFFGPTCNETCKSLCIDSVCGQETGKCLKGCRGSNNDPVCQVSLKGGPDDPPLNLIGPIVGGVAGLIAVICGIVAFVCIKRRMGKPDQQSKEVNSERAKEEGPVYVNYRETELLEDDAEGQDALQGTVNVIDIGEVEINDRSNDEANKANEALYKNESNRVKVTDLFSYVTARDDDSFASEFQDLSKGLDLEEHCTFARRPENIGLNRYNGMYPYDHSRVTIPGQPGFFINACYIDGYKRQKAYIASLGPTAKTTDKFSTFWRMVWHEKSDIIVMLTNLREASGMKCERYWPELEKEDGYGQINVKCRSIEEFAEYTVRTLSISKGKEQRNLLQLHYTAWPDKGVPREVTSLEEFRQRVKAVPSALGGPVIVHCSAGVGRTGTYLALDMLTEEGNCEGYVDVFSCVNKMREQRVNMVQTAEQYKFLYKTLVHALSFGSKAITAEEIQGFLYKADDRVFTDMFQTLRKEVDIEKQEDLDEREENRRRHKDKNRRHSDIPSNRNRVRLYFLRGDGHHDYINAVFINSFKIKDLFIAAQSPLPLTVEDFLCMIYQQDSTCVVALEDPRNQNNDVGKYLPADNETYKCGDYTVTSSKCETKQQYILKKLSIENTRKREAKTVHHFQYNKWGHSKKVPDNVADFVHFIKDVENCLRKRTSDTRHIVVHCLSGYERSGLFCVVYKLLEKLDAERQVSVVNTVRKIRTHRRQAISCVEQLKFCYQSISAYLEINNTYTNFTA